MAWEVGEEDDHRRMARVMFPWNWGRNVPYAELTHMVGKAFHSFVKRWNEMLPWKRMQWAYDYLAATPFVFTKNEDHFAAHTYHLSPGPHSILACTWDQVVTLLALTFFFQNPSVSTSRIKVLPQRLRWEGCGVLQELDPALHRGLIWCE